MDALAGLLDGPRARGAFLLRMVMEPPWAVRIEDRAPICLMSVRRGTAFIVPSGGGEPVRLGPGDIAVARGPDPYTVADAPGTTPTRSSVPAASAPRCTACCSPRTWC